MQDLNNAVNAAMANITSNGTVEKIIEEQLTKTVSSLIHDQLREYSDFGKALKEKIDTDLSVSLSNVTFTEYNKTILNLIEGAVNNAVTGEAQEKLKSDLNKLFEAPPKVVKLSEIIEKYKEESQDYDRDDAEKIALIIEPKEYGSITVALNPKDTKGYRAEQVDSWHDCELFMSIRIDEESENEGKLTRTYDGSTLKPHQFMPTCMSGVSRLLYQMFCAGSTFIFDEGFDSDSYDIYYPDRCY
jgi:hypothetical protein